MQLGSVSIATITWTRSPAEEAVLRRSLSRLAELKVPVAVADAGSSEPFVTFLKSLSGFRVVVPGRSGLVAQVTASLELAAQGGAPYLLYTEPDKEQFFGDSLQQFVEAAGDADARVAIAARSDDSFATFPPLQRYTEGVLNHLCATVIGHPGDYSYGPFLMTRALLSAAADLRPDLGWGWRPCMFLAAHRRGLRLQHVVGHHPCPVDQQTEDDQEQMHRLRQLSQNISGLTL